jgi:hypothetical protein
MPNDKFPSCPPTFFMFAFFPTSWSIYPIHHIDYWIWYVPNLLQSHLLPSWTLMILVVHVIYLLLLINHIYNYRIFNINWQFAFFYVSLLCISVRGFDIISIHQLFCLGGECTFKWLKNGKNYNPYESIQDSLK